MASLLLKKTATIIYVKCVCNVNYPRASGAGEQKETKEQKEQKIGNGLITPKGISASELGFLFFLIKKNQTSRNMTY